MPVAAELRRPDNQLHMPDAAELHRPDNQLHMPDAAELRWKTSLSAGGLALALIGYKLPAETNRTRNPDEERFDGGKEQAGGAVREEGGRGGVEPALEPVRPAAHRGRRAARQHPRRG